MAVSSVRVTEGSGPYLHTWQRSISSVNREDQYVQLGEPALPTFGAVAAMSCATTDSHLIQIMSGSSTYTRIHKVSVGQLAAAGTAASVYLLLVRLTTAGTGGTSVSCAPLDTADTANATAMTLPSSKGTEGTWLYAQQITLTATTGTGRWEWESSPRCKPIVIPSGTSNGLALKIQTGVASATAIVSVHFTETAWL